MNTQAKRYRRPALWRHPVVLGRRLLRSWPMGLWLMAVVVVIYLYQGASKLGGMSGAVESLVQPVAPLETARLTRLHVTLGQRVQAGEVVATMDTLLFDAQAAIDEARLIEVEGTIQNYQQRVLEFVREFETETSRARFDLQMQRLNQARDNSVLAVLRAELAHLEDLRGKGLVSDRDLASLRPDIAALEQTVAAYPELVRIHEERLRAAETDETTMRALLSPDDSATMDIMGTIQDMRQALAEIIRTSRERRDLQRAGYALRASADGVVARILHNEGNVVTAGSEVLRIVAEKPTRVIGFLPEVHLRDMGLGDTVTISRQSDRGQGFTGVVASISPVIEALPGRISPIRGVALRGRRVVIDCGDQHDLIPGETVRVILGTPRPWSWMNTIE